MMARPSSRGTWDMTERRKQTSPVDYKTAKGLFFFTTATSFVGLFCLALSGKIGDTFREVSIATNSLWLGGATVSIQKTVGLEGQRSSSLGRPVLGPYSFLGPEIISARPIPFFQGTVSLEFLVLTSICILFKKTFSW